MLSGLHRGALRSSAVAFRFAGARGSARPLAAPLLTTPRHAFSTSLSDADTTSTAVVSPAADAAASVLDVAAPIVDVVARGDLASLGLASAFTPVGWVQNALEVLHISAGLSWPVSVIALTVGVRVFLLPLVVKQMRTAAKLAGMKPEMEQIQAESRRAYESGDATSLNLVQTKMAALYRKHEVNPISMLVPALAQMPVFISTFMALRQLAELKLASFAVTSGPLASLVTSLAEPSLPLVAVNTALFLAAFEIGADTGQQRLEPKMKNFMRVVILGTGIFTYQLPTLVITYWISSSTFSLAQAGALRYIKPLRAALRIPDIPAHDSKAPSMTEQFSASASARQLSNDIANAKLAAQQRKEQIIKEGPKPLLSQKPSLAQIKAHLEEVAAAKAATKK